MAEIDDIIHQPLRLRIMAGLNALPPGTGLEFSKLKQLTGATDGNLGAHIETLSKAGYVAVDKAFVGKKPQTTVTATAAGRGAFARHVAMLQEIIAAATKPLTIISGADDELMFTDKYAEAVRGAKVAVDVRVLDGINHMGIVAAPSAVSIVAEDVATRAMAGS